MDALEWSRQRKRDNVTQQSYRRGRDIRQTSQLDDNELGKYILTLRHRDKNELQQIVCNLTKENNSSQEPVSAFGKRSGNEYLGRFKVLQQHVINHLPSNWDDKGTLQGLRWLKRLLDIEDSDRKEHLQGQDRLLSWLMDDE